MLIAARKERPTRRKLKITKKQKEVRELSIWGLIKYRSK